MPPLPIQESSCPIDWQPSALAPVFYGYREYTTADGAPMTVRVYYPSLDGAPDGAPPLLGCGRYPLIMFCHGYCPGEPLQYQKWFELPAQLARAGYVVAVPQIEKIDGLPQDRPEVQPLLHGLLDWMRAGWEHRDTLLPPPATGLAGHSYGALHAGILATTRPVLAVASLSGVWEELSQQPFPIHQGAPARLFTWGTNTDSEAYADLPPQYWNPVPQPKYRVLFAGAEHFDYLYDTELRCRKLRGPCPFVGAYTTDTVTMFFARYLQPEHWPDLSTKIDDSLIPPTTAELAQNLTPEQQFFLGGYLAGVPAFNDSSRCKIALRESPPDLIEGQLLFYRDNTREGVGDLHSPSVIGQGGWQYLTKVFSGGDGILYAVNTQGELLFYRDHNRDGTGDVNTPSVIGLGGWQHMQHLFGGDPGVIYAVDDQGQLLFYRDHNRDGTGDVHTPSVIGLGGWQNMQHLTYGGDGIIYAVDDQGRLLFYRDHNRDGTGDVHTPSVIGLGGWQHMKRLVAGEQGVLYAVDDLGRLLYYRDYHRDGSGDVNTPQVIGNGGWQAFSQLTYGGSKILYAVVGA
ncbi:MAG TPA: tachylectin-related carbohydrate-binding protein [Jatrophihabitans sp.]|uniref:tachylectin-related carbohydrate-binding protein n=1 Tax=Jatrophihabitans sp. TaxID=1932789 RepID=UPI002EFE6670